MPRTRAGCLILPSAAYLLCTIGVFKIPIESIDSGTVKLMDFKLL